MCLLEWESGYEIAWVLTVQLVVHLDEVESDGLGFCGRWMVRPYDEGYMDANWAPGETANMMGRILGLQDY